MEKDRSENITRRNFLKRSTVVGSVVAAAPMSRGNFAYAGGSDLLRVGVIGCGGRGSGAAVNAVEAADGVEIYAMADLFEDHLKESRKNLEKRIPEYMSVPDDRVFIGFDAYKRVVELQEIDYVILATPPAYRPIHLRAALEAGKHVFMEKPAATDPAGIRSVIESAKLADQKNLSVVAGTQRRHHSGYIETMRRLQEGEIGEITGGRVFYNTGELWMVERQPGMSDMEWQCRNWYYFTWLSGDHIVEQAVHRLDILNWAMGSPPEKAVAVGGRQVRTDPSFGHIFDHFSVEYTYPNGARIHHMCRQMDGTKREVGEYFFGNQGTCHTSDDDLRIENSAGTWQFDREATNPYVQEHTDLIKSIRSGNPLNEAEQVAESTLTGIMGREAAYTGREIMWHQIQDANQNLLPDTFGFGPAPFPAVPIPGQTALERNWGA